MVSWYILWKFCIFCGNLVYFPRFGILCQEKSGNPGAPHVKNIAEEGLIEN
jgi:hypothetical protein